MNEESKSPEMSPEELGLLIEENTMLQYALKVMNDIPLSDESPVDYMELWNKVALNKKVDAGEVTPESLAFYYSLLTTGYDNFGTMFFYHMANSDNCAIFYYAVKCLLDGLTDNAKEQ